MYILCADPPLDGMGLTIFWFSRVGAEATARNVRQQQNKRGDVKINAAASTLYKQGTIQCADSNHDFATTTVARVPHYTTLGKLLLSYPRNSALLRFVRPEPTLLQRYL